MVYASDEDLLPVRRAPRSVWDRSGLTRRQQRRLNVTLAGTVLLLLTGWVYATMEVLGSGALPSVARRVAATPNLLARDAPAPATFLLEAAVDRFTDWQENRRGVSGGVRIVVQETGDSLLLPDSVPTGVLVQYRSVEGQDQLEAAVPGKGGPLEPGVWNILLRMRDAVQMVPGLSIVSLVPASEVRDGRLGSYRIGAWPDETGAYAPPGGFVPVTQGNRDTPVSEHIRLGDLLTKGQDDVWPKYVAVSTLVLDKVELTLQELERRGHPVDSIFVISGFRTPWYNATGGDTSGRGALSRHMYGDAIDFAIDNDGDGRMDDLNHDGQVTVADARVVAEAAEAVERAHPSLIGGIGVYAPTGAHAGFVHVDTRGYRARW